MNSHLETVALRAVCLCSAISLLGSFAIPTEAAVQPEWPAPPPQTFQDASCNNQFESTCSNDLGAVIYTAKLGGNQTISYKGINFTINLNVGESVYGGFNSDGNPYPRCWANPEYTPNEYPPCTDTAGQCGQYWIGLNTTGAPSLTTGPGYTYKCGM
jgi:hypothetical protein